MLAPVYQVVGFLVVWWWIFTALGGG